MPSHAAVKSVESSEAPGIAAGAGSQTRPPGGRASARAAVSEGVPGSPGASPSPARTFIATAFVAGLFGLIVCAAMMIFHLRSKTDDPLKLPQITALKEQLAATPQNEQLKQKIRDLDLQLRRRYFYQLSLTVSGGYLVLGGLAIFLIAAKRVGALRKKLPCPQPRNDGNDEPARAAAWMRWSVAASGGLVAGALLSLALTTRTRLPNDVGQLEKLAGGGSTAVGGGAPDFASPEEMRNNWPRFLGPEGNAFLTATNVPLIWDVKTGAGVAWKTAVPAPGLNSPVVWDDRVFLAGGDRATRECFCFSARNGELLWRRAVAVPSAGPKENWEAPEQTGAAAATMATDGRRVYAMFANGDLAAFDLGGNPVWIKNLGRPQNSFGHAASLAVWQGRLIVQLDQGGSEERKSRLYAFDGASGRVIWQRQRPVPDSWASPLVIHAAGRPQIIALGVPWAISYSATDGTEVWRAECLNGEITPSPIFAGGLVLVVSPNETLAALRPDGQGDVSKTHVVWSAQDNVPDITTPVSNGQLVFTLGSLGMLTCYDVNDGRKQWEHDFNLEFQASPGIAGDRLYLVGLKGTVVVVQAGRQFHELARTEMAEKIFASPAFARNRIFLRGDQHLYGLGAPAEKLAKRE